MTSLSETSLGFRRSNGNYFYF